MDASEVPSWVQALGALIGTSFVAGALTLKERKKSKQEPLVEPGAAGTSVVAATFTERGQMERLISSIQQLDGTVKDSTACSHELVLLLRADAHRREVQAEVAQALKRKGIIE